MSYSNNWGFADAYNEFGKAIKYSEAEEDPESNEIDYVTQCDLIFARNGYYNYMIEIDGDYEEESTHILSQYLSHFSPIKHSSFLIAIISSQSLLLFSTTEINTNNMTNLTNDIYNNIGISIKITNHTDRDPKYYENFLTSIVLYLCTSQLYNDGWFSCGHHTIGENDYNSLKVKRFAKNVSSQPNLYYGLSILNVSRDAATACTTTGIPHTSSAGTGTLYTPSSGTGTTHTSAAVTYVVTIRYRIFALKMLPLSNMIDPDNCTIGELCTMLLVYTAYTVY